MGVVGFRGVSTEGETTRMEVQRAKFPGLEEESQVDGVKVLR